MRFGPNPDRENPRSIFEDSVFRLRFSLDFAAGALRKPAAAIGLTSWRARLIGAVLTAQNALKLDQLDANGEASELGAKGSDVLSVTIVGQL
ncbi:hypothetical protein AKJ13_07115 [Methylobacterium sp. ARG-1]|nr:hypothetical protein AKJ13_07115 [Methylobacterium sp. ARG-1]